VRGVVRTLIGVSDDIAEAAFESQRRETEERDMRIKLLERRVAYLEGQLARVEQGVKPSPARVGDLQEMATTRAFLLFPNIGRTAVYPLGPGDAATLNLPERTEALSCEHI